MIRKLLLGLLAVIALFVGAVVAVVVIADDPRPSGVSGPEAEALAEKMLRAVGARAWDDVESVHWRMRAGRPLLTWDRQRDQLEAVYDGETPPVKVLVDLATQKGQATRGGQPLDNAASQPWVERAWADFCNDSFWLNAPTKVRDEGTTRSIVEVDGRDALLVEYGGGGVTPGDAYLWELDDNGRPTAWRMWVSIIPVGGLRVTWDDWIELDGGTWLAREKVGPFGLTLRHEPLRLGEPGAGDAAKEPQEGGGVAPSSQPAAEIDDLGAPTGNAGP